MPGVLEQLGIKLPPLPETGVASGKGITEEGRPAGAIPVAEATATAGLGNLKDIGESIVAGAILALEQVVPAFGITTEEGRSILKAIDALSKVVSPEKITEVQTMMMQATTAPPVTTPPATTATQPAGATTAPVTPPAGGEIPPELEALMKGGR